jgi:hypothetical protein
LKSTCRIDSDEVERHSCHAGTVNYTAGRVRCLTMIRDWIVTQRRVLDISVKQTCHRNEVVDITADLPSSLPSLRPAQAFSRSISSTVRFHVTLHRFSSISLTGLAIFNDPNNGVAALPASATTFPSESLPSCPQSDPWLRLDLAGPQWTTNPSRRPSRCVP